MGQSYWSVLEQIPFEKYLDIGIRYRYKYRYYVENVFI